MSAEYDLKRYRADANRLRSEIGKASSAVAGKRKKAADAMSAASKSKSAFSIKSKLSESERATKEANEAEKRRADLEVRRAGAELKATRALEKVEKENRTSQNRAMAELQRRTDRAAAQFIPPHRPSSFASTRPANAPDPIRDVFLSHASEDKDEMARPIQEALDARGVTVWFDEIHIKVGHSIRQSIERGIAACRFGVVIVSPHFFAKQWTNAELDALFSKKMDSGENLVLPIWHRVSKDEVLSQSSFLAGIHALNSATITVGEMADALAEVVKA